MLESGISNIMMFFVIVGVAVIFIVTWIIKSESRVAVAKDQIKTLRLRLEAGERERYMLSEKLSAVETAPRVAEKASISKEGPRFEDDGVSKRKLAEAIKIKEALEEENGKLKSELAEATASLAEVYKALCEK